jgi:hypothetical protein
LPELSELSELSDVSSADPDEDSGEEILGKRTPEEDETAPPAKRPKADNDDS